MAQDPLGEFRRNTKIEQRNDGDSSSDYQAFKVVDRRQIRLQIRPANKAWERLPYGYLLRVVEDGLYGTEVCLVFTFMVVVILGRNLRGLGEAIGEERCEFVEQLDEERFEKPADAKAPLIESITIYEKTADREALDKRPTELVD
ncbi:MAG TPA: hypothetical protein VHE55_06095 [Fimbriimonadaceae bacterium]|nr:hypothetical protein [Fimbriimonadaceae bacterium]